MFNIYLIKNKLNNKVYIGKTKSLDARLAKHFSCAKTGINCFVIHKAIAKWGLQNFEVFVLEKLADEQLAIEKEVFWIDHYKSNITKYGNEFGYNLTAGGEGLSGYKHTEESKILMSIASLGKPKSEDHKKSLSESHAGKSLSAQHKLNIGKSVSGKTRGEDSKIKYSESKTGSKNPQSKLTDFLVKEIKIILNSGTISIKDLAVKYGVSPRTIRDVKNNKTWTHIK